MPGKGKIVSASGQRAGHAWVVCGLSSMLREAHSRPQASGVPFSTLLLKYPGDLREGMQLPKVLNLQAARAPV